MKVAILGPLCIDRITVDDTTEMQPGSIPYYAGHALFALGVDTELFVTYGKSEDAWFRENLTGLKINHIEAEKTLQISSAFCSDDPDTRSVYEIEHAKNVIEPTSELVQALKDFDYVFLSPLFNDNIPVDLFKQLRDATSGKLVHGNFGMFTQALNNKFIQNDPGNLIQALKYIDYLFLDENEVKLVTGKSDQNKAAEQILSHGVELLAVTNGSKGSNLYTSEGKITVPAFPPKTLADPTGAGDTYMAGFIRSLELFDDLEKSGHFAAMTATVSLEKRGAFVGDIEEVYRRLDWSK